MANFQAYLRFDDEGQAKRLLPDWVDKDGKWKRPTPKVNFDPVGALFSDYGENDPETGEVIREPVKRDGWHINVIKAVIPAAALQHVVTPEKPDRTLAE